MSEEELLKNLKYEEDKGYPSFRNEIKRLLIDNYGISEDKANEMVSCDFISKYLKEDIYWSEHMGAGYFSKLLVEVMDNKV